MITVDSIDSAIKNLPPHLQEQALSYISALIEQSEGKKPGKMQFKWAGCAVDLKDTYTSSHLQKKILKWWI